MTQDIRIFLRNGFHNINTLKELWNYKQKLFVSTTKIGKNTTNILKLLFFVTFCHIKPNIYIQKTKFASHKQYLFLLLISRNEKKDFNWPKYTTHFLTFSGKKRPTNLYKWHLQKPFPPMCMLLLQLASMNVFYSMWWLEDIAFHESLSCVALRFS